MKETKTVSTLRWIALILGGSIAVLIVVGMCTNMTPKEVSKPLPIRAPGEEKGLSGRTSETPSKTSTKTSTKKGFVELNRTAYNEYESCMNRAKAVIDGGRKLDGQDMATMCFGESMRKYGEEQTKAVMKAYFE